jgi:IPT/TIG domain
MGLVHRIVPPCLIGGALAFMLVGCSSGKTTNPPTIASFSPLQGPVNSEIVATGTGFMETTGISIGGVAASTWSIANDNQIGFYVPAAAQSGVISLSNSAGTATTSVQFYVVPSATSLSSTTAPSNGLTMNPGDTVTISGSGFVGTTAVSFFGPTLTLAGASATPVSTPATFTVVNANTITTSVPTGIAAGQKYILTVTAPGSNSSNTCSSPSFTIQ